MQNDCEIYVDPEEDEVFFGCVSEREKTVSAKLVNISGSSSKNDRTVIEVLNVCDPDEKDLENTSKNEQSIKEVVSMGKTDSTDPHQEVKNFENNQDLCEIFPNNSSVELDHNYSTPMKHKIDKSILTTPKSVVKADKDGGFLKVLSEIALVKAEAEGDKKSEVKREDEDKENKAVTPPPPEIKITEATPEKGTVLSPPKSINTEFRRFRIIYNSPRNETNADSKAKIDSFESEKNFKNMRLDRDIEKRKERRKSIDLIDFNELPDKCDLNDCAFLEKKEETYSKSSEECIELVITSEPEVIMLSEENSKSPPKVDTQLQKTPLKPVRFSKDAKKVVEVLKKSTADDTLNFTISELNVEEENSFLSPEVGSAFDETVYLNKNAKIEPNKQLLGGGDVISLNIMKQPADNKVTIKSNTVEKNRKKLTPITSQSKLQPMKYFTERRIYNQSETKNKCVKKLPMEEKRPVTIEKVNGKRMVESNSMSRIPVFGAVKSKVPLNERPLTAKITPSKGKSYKNSKFNHIESPINAYIHNKPTSLFVNVKPDVKKNGLTKTLESYATSSEKKIQEKATKIQNPKSAVRLPFVEYKSATPYKIEKRPESRLPRLAPNVMKLIGTNSPKVLRHEGRYFVNSPRKHSSTENSTIVADPNEVSVVVSRPVQKSHTIK